MACFPIPLRAVNSPAIPHERWVSAEGAAHTKLFRAAPIDYAQGRLAGGQLSYTPAKGSIICPGGWATLPTHPLTKRVDDFSLKTQFQFTRPVSGHGFSRAVKRMKKHFLSAEGQRAA